MTIRHSAFADLPVLMDLYRESREIMLSCGDVNQWKPGYPTEEIIRDDIAKGIATACFDHLLSGDPRLAFQKILP